MAQGYQRDRVINRVEGEMLARVIKDTQGKRGMRFKIRMDRRAAFGR